MDGRLLDIILIKELLNTPLVFCLVIATGRLRLEGDISKMGSQGALFQFQKDQGYELVITQRSYCKQYTITILQR